MDKRISVIIPARNEEYLIDKTLFAALEAVSVLAGKPLERLVLGQTPVEVIIVDNISEDRTRTCVEPFVHKYGVQLIECKRLKASCARNEGVKKSLGDILCFVDADTLIPPGLLSRIIYLCEQQGYWSGIFRLASLERGVRAFLWWRFWHLIRRIPWSRTKSMPACMFCTRACFDTFGPFDEKVEIAEEWPLLKDVYQQDPQKVIYDDSLTALSSSRRMELQHFGYTRTLCKYIYAVTSSRGRKNFTDTIRLKAEEAD